MTDYRWRSGRMHYHVWIAGILPDTVVLTEHRALALVHEYQTEDSGYSWRRCLYKRCQPGGLWGRNN